MTMSGTWKSKRWPSATSNRMITPWSWEGRQATTPMHWRSGQWRPRLQPGISTAIAALGWDFLDELWASVFTFFIYESMFFYLQCFVFVLLLLFVSAVACDSRFLSNQIVCISLWTNYSYLLSSVANLGLPILWWRSFSAKYAHDKVNKLLCAYMMIERIVMGLIVYLHA